MELSQTSQRGQPAEGSSKAGDKPEEALSVYRGAIRASSPDPSILSIDDSNNIRLGRNPDYVPLHDVHRHSSQSPALPNYAKAKLQSFWTRNKGLAFVLISQLFGTLMNVTTRMLEMEGNDGEQLALLRHEFELTHHRRQRLPSISDPLCQDGNHCDVLLLLHVV